MSTSHATSQPIQSSNSDESQEAKFMQTVIPPKTRDRSLSRSPEKLEANKSMRELSDFLITSGLPPLPERIFESKLPEPMAKSLNMGVGHLLQEYHRRGQIIQQLVGKLSDADRREEDWEIKLKEVEEKWKNQTSQESSMVEGLQTNLDRMVNKSKDMAGDLELSKAEAADLKARYEALKKQIEKESSDADMLKKQLHNVLEKMEKQRERNERSFEAIAKQHQKFRRDPSKSGIDRMTLEVVDVYESKLESVQNELNSMRLMLKSQKSKENVEEESPVTPPPESEQEDENEHGTTFTKKPRKLVEDIGNPQGDEFIRLRVAMEQQIKLLQKRLDETNDLLAKSENEKELLKLELLQFRKPPKAFSTQESGSRQTEFGEEEKLSTREKIRRDKLNYKLRLYKIDEMNAERCRNYLKDICIRLDINDINQVSTALSEVSKVLHLVPQMQRFIKQVDAIIWAHQHAVVNVTVDQNADRSSPNPPMHKFRDTIKALQIWSEELETLDGLRKFIEKIYRLLRLNDNDDEDADVKALCVEEIKRLIAFEKNTHRAERSKMKESEESTYTRIVNHFCNLFEITTLSGVFPKMNELYVFVSEVDVGLKQIRELLELDQNVKVSTILTKAADQILIALSNAQSQQPHRPLDTFRNRSHLSDVQNKSSSSALTSLESLLERVSSEHTKKTILDELELEGFGRDKVDREIREEIRMRAERERQEERVNERSKVD
ncbi:hypothetical protein BKA69DRAFT_385686 [Paraphysoderma sedebokerense]|nr:hypothetical protein BKA69DRAFT_385686 [Paraphysoderma sedebokerense]